MKDREPLNKITLHEKAKVQIELGNLAVGPIIQEICPDLTQCNEVLYATAKVMTDLCSNSMKSKKKKPHQRKKPMWKEKIEREIEHMQGELSILTELQREINVKGRACITLKRKYKINKDSIICKKTVKQKMQLKAQRLRRYEKGNKFYCQNVTFKRDAQKFYKEIGKETKTVNDALSIEEVKDFWKDIWSEENGFNK